MSAAFESPASSALRARRSQLHGSAYSLWNVKNRRFDSSSAASAYCSSMSRLKQATQHHASSVSLSPSGGGGLSTSSTLVSRGPPTRSATSRLRALARLRFASSCEDMQRPPSRRGGGGGSGQQRPRPRPPPPTNARFHPPSSLDSRRHREHSRSHTTLDTIVRPDGCCERCLYGESGWGDVHSCWGRS